MLEGMTEVERGIRTLINYGRAHVEVKINLSSWDAEFAKDLIDRLVEESSDLAKTLPVDIRGIRMPPNLFSTIGADGDPMRGGYYRDVPVATVDVDFDTLEIVLEPSRATRNV